MTRLSLSIGLALVTSGAAVAQGEDSLAGRISFAAGALAPLVGQALALGARLPGETAADKASELATQMVCVEGGALDKVKVGALLLEIRRAWQADPDAAAEGNRLRALAAKYWATVFRPLGGLDGKFNQGDTAAVLSCLDQGQVDALVSKAFPLAVRPYIRGKVAFLEGIALGFVDGESPSATAKRARIERRFDELADRKTKELLEKYEQDKAGYRARAEISGKRALDDWLRGHGSESRWEEARCGGGSDLDYRRLDLAALSRLASQWTGASEEALLRDEVGAALTGSPSRWFKKPGAFLDKLSPKVEIVFPEGFPMDSLEGFVSGGTIPTRLVVRLKEEVREIGGRREAVRRVEVAPQRVGLGVNLKEVAYRRPDGKLVRYPTIVNVFPGSVAERLGLTPGTYLESLGGEDLGDRGVASVVTHLDRAARSGDRRVKITVRQPDGSGERRTRAMETTVDAPCEAFESGADTEPFQTQSEDARTH